MKRLLVVSLLCLIVGGLIGWWTTNHFRYPQTLIFCATEQAYVYTEPNVNSNVFYVVPAREKVWWSGARTERWLFVSHVRGDGWVETAKFDQCKPDSSRLPSAWEDG